MPAHPSCAAPEWSVVCRFSWRHQFPGLCQMVGINYGCRRIVSQFKRFVSKGVDCAEVSAGDFKKSNECPGIKGERGRAGDRATMRDIAERLLAREEAEVG